MLPLDTSCQAEYEDGYILDETEQEDISAWSEGHNVFHDILKRLPEAQHGRMVRFSCFWNDQRYDIDWTELPENARPIRFRHGFAKISGLGEHMESGWSGMDFGWQATVDGKNVQEVIELR